MESGLTLPLHESCMMGSLPCRKLSLSVHKCGLSLSSISLYGDESYLLCRGMSLDVEGVGVVSLHVVWVAGRELHGK